jgi:hypothetical protein
MDPEIERKLRDIRYEDRKFTMRLISAVAAVAGVPLALGITAGWIPQGAAFKIERRSTPVPFDPI